MTEHMNQGRKIILKGAFEKTGFLFLCMKEAERLELKGEASFLYEETVQVLLYGSQLNIEKFIAWSVDSLKPLEIKIRSVEKIPFRERAYFMMN